MYIIDSLSLDIWHLFLSFDVFLHSSVLGMLQYFTVSFWTASPCVYLSLLLYTPRGVQEGTNLTKAHTQGIPEEHTCLKAEATINETCSTFYLDQLFSQIHHQDMRMWGKVKRVWDEWVSFRNATVLWRNYKIWVIRLEK